MNTDAIFQHPIVEELRKASPELAQHLYLVGGAVRDFVISGKMPTDWDFSTPLKVERVLELLDGRYAFWEAGREFGTIGVFIKGEKVDITTFRVENYPDETRFPVVNFVEDLRFDTARRDFTMNSLVIDPQGTVIDHHGGLEDIKKGLVRAVGMPEERFSEDPHRIMRMYRFALQYGFKVVPGTLQGASSTARKVLGVSRERWAMEMNKILALYRGSETDFGLMRHLFLDSVGPYILPEVALLDGIIQFGPYHRGDTVLDHTLRTIEWVNVFPPTKLSLLWAALLHDIGKLTTGHVHRESSGQVSHFYGHETVGAMMAEGILERFRLGHDITDEALCLVRWHMVPLELANNSHTPKAIRRLINRTAPWTNDLMELALADRGAQLGSNLESTDSLCDLRDLIKAIPTYEEGKAYELPKGLGDHIMRSFDLGPGPRVGNTIDAIVQAIEEGTIPAAPSMAEAIGVVKEFLKGEDKHG